MKLSRISIRRSTYINNMLMQLITTTLLLLASTTTTQVAESATQPNPSCQTTCGNLTNIPFPFGIGPDCYIHESFHITCNTTYNPPRPFIRRSTIPVLSISLDQAYIRVASHVSSYCYNTQTDSYVTDRVGVPRLPLLNFALSSTRNKFTAVGCATAAIVQTFMGVNYTTGCISVCNSNDSFIRGSCESGVGCCRTTIPHGISGFQITVQSFGNRSSVESFNPCVYAFVGEENAFNFSSHGLLNTNTRMPVVLDWGIERVTCEEAKTNGSTYACRSLNSKCVDTLNGQGYRCNCSSGYQGNPYLNDGCEDINECETANICGYGSVCTNVPGKFVCSCLEGYDGNGRNCRKRAKASTVLQISLGTSISLLGLMLGISWVYWVLNTRKLMKQREKFFQQNGGFLLKEKLSKDNGSIAKIFTAKELKKATNNYDPNRVIGQGGFGTVYKGYLPDNRVVAVKKSKISDESQVKQFINEVVVLSQINHRNVVKLIGCCLETEVPLLVYEFITSGTLSDHLHNVHGAPFLSWEMRLKIAVETATALSYLHSETSIPIIHRDIKSTNILLDKDFTAKVSDFGASRLIPLSKSQLTTLVQGTFGYLDPEYFYTGKLTEKSDVYSFGVVLVELLTGEKAVSFVQTEEYRSLAMYFLSSIEKDCCFGILEERFVQGGNIDQMKEVVVLAKRCLGVKGEERPKMKEVAVELERLRSIDKQLQVDRNLDLADYRNFRDNSMYMDFSIDFLDDSTSFSTVSRDYSMTSNNKNTRNMISS